GGSDNDCANGLILDDASNVYITGGTRSKDFPVTAGVVQSLAGGGKADGYVTKIKNDGSTVLASTYWGTDMYDQSYFVQLDKQDNVYLFGQTDGKMPVIGKVYSNPDAKHFITKMNNALSNVVFSTVFGNVDSLPTITPTAFLVDVCSNIYVAGWAGRFNKSNFLENGPAFNLPVTANAPDTSTAGHDFYLMVLRANADSLLYGTYWGGDISAEHCHGGTSRFDRKGIVYQSLCTGCGAQQDYPIYPADAYPGIPGQPNGSNNCNNAIFKIDFQVKLALADFSVDYIKGCAPLTVHFKNQSTSGKFLWDFGSNNTSTDLNPVYTFNNAGTYLVKLFVNDPASCNLWDSVYQYITVYEGITTDFETEAAPCSNEITFKDLTVKNPISWEWDFGDGDKSTLQNPKHTFKEFNKTYPVTLISKSANGCTDTTTVDVDFVGFTTAINADQTVCKGAPVQLKATGGFEYRWVPTAGLSDPTIPDPIATPDTTTIYEVHIKTKNALGDTCESILSTKITVMDPSKISLVATADKDTIVKGETTTIHALTDPSLKIHWTPTTNVNNPTAFNTLVTPPVTTTYTVSINDSLGCSRSATVTIYVVSDECEESNVFVPNTFTPNGDGQNDILYARSNVVSTIYFAVYNRWGQLVFETTDLKKGWDGNYKGMKADPAVFAWYVKGKCFNGKEFFKKGNVTLIR
ncbi:MAG TPA: PKD domain-containing protein, partial [Bacteroidia bacterium]|nr:PKD domain-containing protein [Bacteroidia bacterium]